MSNNVISINSLRDDFYFNSLDEVRNSEEYIQNQKQIDCITKVLIEHSDVPKQLVDWLIESVQENVALEYESYINKK